MKSIFESKIFWVAILQGILGVVVVVQGLNPDLGKLMLVKSFLDIVLRFLTDKPVTL